VKGAYLILKDKVFYSIHEKKRFVLGNAVNVGKKLKDVGFGLLHVVDEDLNKGFMKNFDVYDKLTYFIHVQVEMPSQRFVEKLKEINVRTVALPWLYTPKEDFSAVFVKKGFEEWIEKFRDIVVDNEEVAKRIEGNKRIFTINFKFEGAFCEINYIKPSFIL